MDAKDEIIFELILAHNQTLRSSESQSVKLQVENLV
ncbi:unnamed protein product [uncultured virus]|nr:unnamed protein product [uncultured virus]